MARRTVRGPELSEHFWKGLAILVVASVAGLLVLVGPVDLDADGFGPSTAERVPWPVAILCTAFCAAVALAVLWSWERAHRRRLARRQQEWEDGVARRRAREGC